MKRGGRAAIGLLGLLALCAGVVSFGLFFSRQSKPIYGATFSDLYARQLGLNPREAYLAVLDELAVTSVRLPVYWSETEHENDQFDFDNIDWMMNEAGARGVAVTLVVGQKVPRWPECYIPDWAEALSLHERESQLLDFAKTVVNRYEHHPALSRWQVENESFFPFGECPAPDPDLIDREIRLVRTFDDAQHPVMLTTSGEQAFWVFRALPADVLGFSLYRVVQNKTFGVLVFPHPSDVYALQRLLARLFVKDVIVSELQVEPWGVNGTRIGEGYGVEAAYALFTAHDVATHISFAKRTGASEVILWGVEWWYYLRMHGDPRLWDAGALYTTGGHE